MRTGTVQKGLIMKNRYYVSPCHEEGKKSTWDVMERAVREGHMRMDESTAVSNHETREQARKAARELNAAQGKDKSTMNLNERQRAKPAWFSWPPQYHPRGQS